MTELDSSQDKALPRLKSYLAAILNVKEKDIDFLPCYNGYLVFIKNKSPICLWIHKNTIEGILKVGFDLIVDTGQDLLFNLVWGGSILRELLKGVIPDPPKDTIIFYPGLHKIEYGTIIPEEGTSGLLVKGITKVTGLANKTSKAIINLIPKEDQKEGTEKLPQKILNKSYTYFKFQDFLYSVITKEKSFKGNLPVLSGGLEFRTAFSEASIEFLKKIEKNGGFVLEYKGEKGLI